MLEVKDVIDIIRNVRDLHIRLLDFEIMHDSELLEIEKCSARIEVLNCLIDEISDKLEEK